jgi:hypothetical protein
VVRGLCGPTQAVDRRGGRGGMRTRGCRGIQGCLAHKKLPPPPGPP